MTVCPFQTITGFQRLIATCMPVPCFRAMKMRTACADIGRCMNLADDVILAYECNGYRLAPDHGFPLRLIVPGYIGGRSIKWLQTIVVSETDSDNHYHVYDNRTLPTGIDLEQADDEGIFQSLTHLLPLFPCQASVVGCYSCADKYSQMLQFFQPGG